MKLLSDYCEIMANDKLRIEVDYFEALWVNCLDFASHHSGGIDLVKIYDLD